MTMPTPSQESQKNGNASQRRRRNRRGTMSHQHLLTLVAIGFLGIAIVWRKVGMVSAWTLPQSLMTSRRQLRTTTTLREDSGILWSKSIVQTGDGTLQLSALRSKAWNAVNVSTSRRTIPPPTAKHYLRIIPSSTTTTSALLASAADNSETSKNGNQSSSSSSGESPSPAPPPAAEDSDSNTVTEAMVLDAVERAETAWATALEARKEANALIDRAEEEAEAASAVAQETQKMVGDNQRQKVPISMQQLAQVDRVAKTNLDATSQVNRAVKASEEADRLEKFAEEALQESERLWEQHLKDFPNSPLSEEE